MLEKVLSVLALILVCSGCATLTEKETPAPIDSPASSQKSAPAQTDSPAPSQKTAPVPSAKSSPTPTSQKKLFAPTFTSTEADTYFDAVEIYDSSPQAPQGVYHYQGLVFVIVCIDTNKEKIKYLEGTAMLRTVAFLRERYPDLPPKFRIRNRVVEKILDDETGIYRYATVYREKDIRRKLKK